MIEGKFSFGERAEVKEKSRQLDEILLSNGEVTNLEMAILNGGGLTRFWYIGPSKKVYSDINN